MLATLIRLKTPLLFINETKAFTTIGKSFFRIRNVYLSGAPYTDMSFFNPFSGIPTMSADNPGFSAIRLPSSAYSSNNNNLTILFAPSASQTGFINVIVENAAGYGTITQYTIQTTLNPYPSSLSEHYVYVPYCKPWQNGIKVLNKPQV